MSALPIHEEPDPRDPEVILHRLPDREREFFVRQYRAAAETAAHDLGAYKELKRLLHAWSLTAIAVNQPGYYQTLDAVKNGTSQTVPFDAAITAELARRRT